MSVMKNVPSRKQPTSTPAENITEMSNLTAQQANESRQLVAAAARGHTTGSCDAHAPIKSPRKSAKAVGKDTLRRDVSPPTICRVVKHVSGRQTVTETAAENLGTTHLHKGYHDFGNGKKLVLDLHDGVDQVLYDCEFRVPNIDICNDTARCPC